MEGSGVEEMGGDSQKVQVSSYKISSEDTEGKLHGSK